jgi:hypothetical protein
MAALHTVWGKNFRNLWMLNSAYSILIPKRQDTDNVEDFRPISLVHSFAKLVTKNLANRLASRLDEMVSPNQSAFIKKRFIQYNFMLVQQTGFSTPKNSQEFFSNLISQKPLILSLGVFSWRFTT